MLSQCKKKNASNKPVLFAFCIRLMQARKGTIWFEVVQFDFLVVCGWSDTDTTLLIPFMHREIFSQDMYVHFFYLCNGFFPAHWMGVNFPVSSGHVLFEASIFAGYIFQNHTTTTTLSKLNGPSLIFFSSWSIFSFTASVEAIVVVR